MNLVRAEARRFFARRFVLIMVTFVLALFALIALGFAVNTQKVTEADRERARAQAAAYVEEVRRQIAAEYQACVSDQSAGGSDRFPPGFSCEDLQAKSGGEFGISEEMFLPAQFDFRRDARDTVYVAAAILCLLGFVVGASFVGAEWTSGGMTNLLLWRPRRLPVLLTKLGVAIGGVLAIGVGYLAVWLGVMWTIAVTRGTTGDPSTGHWRSLGLLGVRALALMVVAAAAGFALASLGRHTAMALGVGIGYAIVWELGTLIVFELLRGRFPERYRLSSYVIAWLSQEYRIYDSFAPCVATSGGGCVPPQYVINLPYAASVLGAVAVVIVAAAFLVFQRRDVA